MPKNPAVSYILRIILCKQSERHCVYVQVAKSNKPKIVHSNIVNPYPANVENMVRF